MTPTCPGPSHRVSLGTTRDPPRARSKTDRHLSPTGSRRRPSTSSVTIDTPDDDVTAAQPEPGSPDPQRTSRYLPPPMTAISEYEEGSRLSVTPLASAAASQRAPGSSERPTDSHQPTGSDPSDEAADSGQPPVGSTPEKSASQSAAASTRVDAPRTEGGDSSPHRDGSDETDTGVVERAPQPVPAPAYRPRSHPLIGTDPAPIGRPRRFGHTGRDRRCARRCPQGSRAGADQPDAGTGPAAGDGIRAGTHARGLAVRRTRLQGRA